MRYPALTQTFIDREMRGVMANGVAVEVHPLWDWGNQASPAPGGPTLRRHGFLRIAGRALGEMIRQPSLVWRGLRAVWRHRPRTAEHWFHTLWGALWAFGMARELRTQPAWIHGAWATAPATAAMTLGRLLGRPFSFGAHAYDLHRHGGDPLLPLKMRRAAFVHTTTEFNVRHLRKRFPSAPAEIVLARRGLPALPPARPESAGNDWAGRSLRFLSVGRLVEKKGQLLWIQALAELARRGAEFHASLVGEGPLRPVLEDAIRHENLESRVTLYGALPPERVQNLHAEADAFFHCGVVDSEGDRDGLPNVVPEAMSWGALVISSPGGGVAEAITHEKTGLIADPHDPTAVADAVQRLIADPALRSGLRTTARAWVSENFLAAKNTARLATRMRSTPK